MMGFGLIWIIALVAVVAYLMGWRPENMSLGGSSRPADEKAPLEILRERYVRGEITKEEFQRMRADLES
ncbi:MAG: SHOCT domain-containing protein [Candidatus Promineifilaceae bacterium]|nr:SHOCT domain-containing protein [Candidatus Promineifilaceae bacterium]